MSWLRDVLGASVSASRLPRSHTETQKSPWLQAVSVVSVVSVDFGKVKIWLTEKLDSVQSVRVLEREAAVFGYTMADLDAARLAIGGVHVTPCLGVDYWHIPDTLHERSKTN